MKTTIIPAQVTTVEDKIAGNLNLTQIILLLFPVLTGTAIYVFLPVPLKFTTYKIPIVLIFFIIFPILSLRIRGRVLINWLVLLFTFLFRPHIYIFNKNDLSLRDSNFKKIKEQKFRDKKAKVKNSKDKKPDSDVFSVDYQILGRDRNMNFRMNRNKVFLTKEL